MTDDAGSNGKLDKTLKDSFPASDPPANSGITGAGTPDKPPGELNKRPADSERHAAETAPQPKSRETPAPKR
jgi:hypothetical protein